MDKERGIFAGIRLAAEDLEKDIAWLVERNADERVRSRELSIAVTHLETALLWIRKSLEGKDVQ